MPSSKPPPPVPAHILRTHSSPVNTISFSEDNERLYSGDLSGTVIVTSTRNLRSLSKWKAHADGLLGVEEWGNSIITHGRDNKLHVWERVVENVSVGDSATVTGLSIPSLRYSMDVNALNFCRFSLLPRPSLDVTVAQTAQVALPNLVDSSLVDIWSLPSQRRLHAAIGKCGVSESDWQADGRGEKKTGILMSIHLFDIQHPSASGRRLLRLLSAYENGSVTLWNNPSERETSVEGRGWEALWTAKRHVESVMAMTVSRDSTVALTSSADHLIVRYDLLKAEYASIESQGECFVAHKLKQAGNGSIAFRDDGRVCAVGGWDGKYVCPPLRLRLLIADPGRIRLFSTKTMKPLGTLAYHTTNCQAISFTHEPHEQTDKASEETVTFTDDDMTDEERLSRSRWLAGAGQDRRVSIWELMSFEKS
ncbi:WD-40 repeat-containing protein [Rickenella mellea]|uniref:ASTRA-associated protein 1 n=1 Tax=Rickenella mellea TaxID=50990 RepID=A0A4Y7QF24_9AGAM|nr:WD-40 repeat-containing protein [Rickenella mellea]